MKNNSSRRILALVGWRYLTHHPWQSILMVAGIALGVAVVVAINLANVSASRAFDISTESLTGRATHQIDGGPQGLDENIYTQLRRSGIPLLSAPVISDYVVSPQLGSQPLELLGVDPFAEAPFRGIPGQQRRGSREWGFPAPGGSRQLQRILNSTRRDPALARPCRALPARAMSVREGGRGVPRTRLPGRN